MEAQNFKAVTGMTPKVLHEMTVEVDSQRKDMVSLAGSKRKTHPRCRFESGPRNGSSGDETNMMGVSVQSNFTY